MPFSRRRCTGDSALVGALLATLLATSAMAQRPRPSRDAAPPQATGFVFAEGAASFLARPLLIGGRSGVGVERGAIAGRFGYSYAQELLAGSALNALSLSVGTVHRTGRLRFAAFVGPALVWGQQDTSPPQSRRYSHVGAVAEGAATVAVAGGVAVGVEVHANVNGAVNSFGGGPVVRLDLGIQP